jgi:hypothetical protein
VNCEVTDDDAGVSYAAFTLTNSTITATRAANGYEALFPYQILEFTAATPAGCTNSNVNLPRTSALCGFAALPVEMLNFNAELNGFKEVELNWTTMSESDNDHFEIQRSQNGIDFEVIGTVEGAGNSSSRIDYEFLDVNPYFGISYYRLKQVDYNGDFENSDTRSVALEVSNIGSFNLIPNPPKGVVTVVSDSELSLSEVIVLDMTGREIQVDKAVSNAGIRLDMRHIVSGVYLIKTENGTKRLVLR